MRKHGKRYSWGCFPKPLPNDDVADRTRDLQDRGGRMMSDLDGTAGSDRPQWAANHWGQSPSWLTRELNCRGLQQSFPLLSGGVSEKRILLPTRAARLGAWGREVGGSRGNATKTAAARRTRLSVETNGGAGLTDQISHSRSQSRRCKTLEGLACMHGPGANATVMTTRAAGSAACWISFFYMHSYCERGETGGTAQKFPFPVNKNNAAVGSCLAISRRLHTSVGGCNSILHQRRRERIPVRRALKM